MDCAKDPDCRQGIPALIADIFTLVGYGVFSILVGLDVWRAYCKRATWLPGKAFAVTGVTVQIIVWWTSLSKFAIYYNDAVDTLIYNHQIVVSGRVAVCVFIGYLLPGMSAPSLRTFLALALTICAQIASELLSLLQEEAELPKSMSIMANLILFTCVIVLGLILGCTILVSKTIHGLLRQRISAITEEDDFQFSNGRTMLITWNDFEDEILKSWFVARVCQIDYVISRSVLSSAVGLVVTICVIVSLLSHIFHDQYLKDNYYDLINTPLFYLLFSFIIEGWVVICWRWLAAQFYFHLHRNSWKNRLCLEDFWTSNIVDLIHTYDLKRDRQQFQRSNSKMQRLSKLQSLPTKIFTKIRLHKLLYLVLMLQVIVVFFIKICGLLSKVTVGKFVYWCCQITKKRDPVKSPENYARILERICMPGEDPSDLWEANHISFNKVKLLIQKGCEKGRSCDEINSFFFLFSLQWIEDGAQLLSILKERALPSVMKQFPSVEKQCVKMTVVSLITIFIGLHKAKSVHLTKVMKACGEVWDLLAFVDECDIDLHANEIVLLDDLNRDKDQVCMAADREFYKLQKEYDKHSFCCEEMHRFLQEQLQKCEGLLIRENLLGDCKEKVGADLSDSKDWMKIEPSYTLYKLYKLILDEDIEDFMAWTEESLRNVIAFSMSRLPDMLVKQCWKWAEEFEEDKLWEAIHLAGKCRGVMEAWGLEPQPTLSTTKQRRIQVTLQTQFVADL